MNLLHRPDSSINNPERRSVKSRGAKIRERRQRAACIVSQIASFSLPLLAIRWPPTIERINGSRSRDRFATCYRRAGQIFRRAWHANRIDGGRGPRQLVTSSREHRRLASVSFGRNTDRLSKRHEATAKTNLKCLLTKQSELAALRRPRETERERENRCFHRLLLSTAIISPLLHRRPCLPLFDPRAVNHNGSRNARYGVARFRD